MIQVVTPPADPPRAITTAMARDWLGEPSAEDKRIKLVVEDATASGERMSPGRWIYQEFRERIRLDHPTQYLYLSARPISTVTSVLFEDESDPIDAGDFEIWPRSLYRSDCWIAGTWVAQYFAGFWLPSMGVTVPAGVEGIGVSGIHLRRSVWEIVQASWAKDHRNPVAGGCHVDEKIKARSEGPIGLVVPPAAAAVLQGEGPPPV